MTEYVLVPREPTPEMIDAGHEVHSLPASIYKAMLSAAPQPEAVAPQGNVAGSFRDLGLPRPTEADTAYIKKHHPYMPFPDSGPLSPPVGEGDVVAWRYMNEEGDDGYADNKSFVDMLIARGVPVTPLYAAHHAPTSNEELVKALANVLTTLREQGAVGRDEKKEKCWIVPHDTLIELEKQIDTALSKHRKG